MGDEDLLISSLVSQVAPLGSIMLKVKLLDMGNPRVLLSTALSPPNLQDIVRTVLQLKEVLTHSEPTVQTGQSFWGRTGQSFWGETGHSMVQATTATRGGVTPDFLCGGSVH